MLVSEFIAICNRFGIDKLVRAAKYTHDEPPEVLSGIVYDWVRSMGLFSFVFVVLWWKDSIFITCAVVVVACAVTTAISHYRDIITHLHITEACRRAVLESACRPLRSANPDERPLMVTPLGEHWVVQVRDSGVRLGPVLTDRATAIEVMRTLESNYTLPMLYALEYAGRLNLGLPAVATKYPREMPLRKRLFVVRSKSNDF